MTRVAGCSLLVLLCLMEGCATFSVHQGKHGIKGVPFYVRTAACKHELVWLEPLYTLRLQLIEPQGDQEKVHDLGIVTLSLSGYQGASGSVLTLKELLRNDQATNGQILTIWRTIEAAGYNPLGQIVPTDNNVVLVANTNTVTSYVNYKDQLTFNSRGPLIGTSKAAIKVADDGTLSEASAEIETKTLQSFLDLIPAKEALTRLLPAAAVAVGPPFRLTIETQAAKHTRYKLVPLEPNGACSPIFAQAFSLYGNYNQLREEVGEAAAKKPDGKTIKVSGEVELPKEGKKP